MGHNPFHFTLISIVLNDEYFFSPPPPSPLGWDASPLHGYLLHSVSPDHIALLICECELSCPITRIRTIGIRVPLEGHNVLNARMHECFKKLRNKCTQIARKKHRSQKSSQVPRQM